MKQLKSAATTCGLRVNESVTIILLYNTLFNTLYNQLFNFSYFKYILLVILVSLGFLLVIEDFLHCSIITFT